VPGNRCRNCHLFPAVTVYRGFGLCDRCSVNAKTRANLDRLIDHNEECLPHGEVTSHE